MILLFNLFEFAYSACEHIFLKFIAVSWRIIGTNRTIMRLICYCNHFFKQLFVLLLYLRIPLTPQLLALGIILLMDGWKVSSDRCAEHEHVRVVHGVCQLGVACLPGPNNPLLMQQLLFILLYFIQDQVARSHHCSIHF